MIYYILHSSFLFETKNYILIFDFYKFPSEKKQEIRNFYSNFLKRRDKKIIVFSTHSHSDHYNSEILDWKKYNSDIKYVLSDDIKAYKHKDIFFVKERDILELDGIKINVFGSTDLGVSFYLNVDNINIFHAGDLHLWHWEDDTEKEEKEMYDKYSSILNEIKKLGGIDFAFTPVDKRLGKNTYEGVKLFYETLKPKNIIPMHFWEEYDVVKDLEEIFSKDDVKIVEIKDNMSLIAE